MECVENVQRMYDQCPKMWEKVKKVEAVFKGYFPRIS